MRNKVEKGGLLWKYFLIFVSVILIPVLIFCLCLYAFMVQRMNAEGEARLLHAVNAIQSTIDAKLMQMDGDLSRLSLELGAGELFQIPLTTEQRMRSLAQVRKSLEICAGTNSFIDVIGVHFAKLNRTLTQSGYYAPTPYIDQQPILLLQSTQREGSFYPYYDDTGTMQLVVAKPVPLLSKINGSFVYSTLNMSEVAGMMQLALTEGTAVLLDDSARVLASSDSSMKLWTPEKRGLYQTKPSQVMSWLYGVYVSPDEANTDATRLRNTIILILLLLSALGVFFSYMLANVFYRPIHQLVHSAQLYMAKHRTLPSVQTRNDLKFLHETVREMNGYASALKHSVDSGRSRVIGNILRHLLDGSSMEPAEVYETLENYSFQYASMQFVLLLFELKSDAIERKWEGWMNRFMLENQLRGLLPQSQWPEVAVVDMGKGKLSAVLLSPLHPPPPIDEAIDTLLRQLSTQWDSVHLCPAGSTSELMELAAYYEKASRALSAAPILPPYRVIDVNKAQEKPSPSGFLSQIWLDKFANRLLTDGVDSVSALLEEWFERRLAQNATLNALREDVIIIAAHVAMSLQKNYTGALIGVEEINLEGVMLINQADWLRDTLTSYCAAAAQAAFGWTVPYTKSYIFKTLEYIHAHYQQDISLMEVADMLSLSPQHLSATFKSEMGQGFSEYVNERRLSEACRLLSETASSVQTIAANTGYNSVQYFARKFKEAYGITPSQFREQTH